MMKTKWVLAALIATFVGCKDSGDSADSQSGAAEADRQGGVNTILVHEQLSDTPKECLYNLANVYSNAIADGLATNGARNDLGTNAPVGKKFEAEGFYFQLLRIFSYFDWEMARQLRLEVGDQCLPENVTVGLAALPSAYVSKLPKPFTEDAAKFEKAFAILAPDWVAPKFAELPGTQFPFAWPGGTAMPAAFNASVKESLSARLQYIRDTIATKGNPTAKLQAMLKASEPVAAWLDAHFPPGDAAHGQLRVTAFLPPFQQLSTPNEDDIDSWTLTPGLTRRDLPRQVDISVARLSEVGYLAEPPSDRIPVIRLDLEKDFAEPDVVRTHIRFGQVVDGQGEVIPVDFRDARNTLYIGFSPNLSVYPSDNAALRKAKEEFNKVGNGYKIDARIHQLTLTLQRPTQSSVAEYDRVDLPLRPHFSFKNSDISFRVHRYTTSGTEKRALGLAGFTCEAQEASSQSHCYLDLGAYTDSVNFVDGDETNSSKGLGTIAGLGRRMVTAAIRVSTKVVVDFNIRAIEDALDQQFVQLVEDAMNDQDELKAKIQKRLAKAVSNP